LYSAHQETAIRRSHSYRSCAEDRTTLVCDGKRPDGNLPNPVHRESVAKLDGAQLAGQGFLDTGKHPGARMATVQVTMKGNEKKEKGEKAQSRQSPFRSRESHSVTCIGPAMRITNKHWEQNGVPAIRCSVATAACC